MKALEMMMKRPSYGDVTVGYCMKFARNLSCENNGDEFYIECDGDSKTYQRAVDFKEGKK